VTDRPDVVVLLEEIRDLLRAAIASRDPARSLRSADRRAMRAILPVLAANFPDSFAVWELIDCRDAPDALGANLRIVLEQRTAPQLGRLFRRACDHDINGLVLRRARSTSAGAMWRCDAIVSP